jgi:hypothetical protein
MSVVSIPFQNPSWKNLMFGKMSAGVRTPKHLPPQNMSTVPDRQTSISNPNSPLPFYSNHIPSTFYQIINCSIYGVRRVCPKTVFATPYAGVTGPRPKIKKEMSLEQETCGDGLAALENHELKTNRPINRSKRTCPPTYDVWLVPLV